MTLRDIASLLVKPFENTVAFVSNPKQYAENAKQQIQNYSYKPADFDIPNKIASFFGGGSEAYKTTMQQPVYPFRGQTIPKLAQIGAKGLLENVLPSFIGTVPIPQATGWSLPRAVGTTAGFGALQKIAGYKNEDILNPVNLGLSMAAGGLKFGEPQAKVPKQVEIKAPKTQQEALQRMSGLLHPEQQYRELVARGYEPQQARKMSSPRFNEVVSRNLSPKEYANEYAPTQFETGEAVGKAFYQASENMPVFNKIFAKFVGKRQAAQTTALEYGSKYKQIPQELAPEIIKYMENSNTNVSPKAKSYAANLRVEFDNLYNYAKQSGIDIGYLKDYLTHVWSEPADVVSQKYQTAGQKFKFAKNRVFPTYEEGLQIGLKPKYNHPAQILAEYVRKLEQTKANVEFINTLKKEGFVVTAGVGARTPGFDMIKAPGFPRNETIINGNKTIIGGWYAPKPVADIINKVFSVNEAPTPLRVSSNISGKLQDVTMSGGVPGTPVNAWTLAQITKELTAGRVKGPLTAVVRSMVNSEGYFKDNAKFIKEQQLNNIPVTTTQNIESLMPKGILEGNIWNRLVNEPTFKRFMPILQTEFYKSVREGLINKGYSEEAAINTASKATKNFYGIVSSDKLIKQNPTFQAVKTTFAFAPKYRESIFNFWVNNLKALKNPLAPENINNTRFLLGAALTYFAMDRINMYYNKRHLMENPSGTEDKLLIPVGNGEVVGIPFLSSIATMPRAALREGLMLARGDVKGAVTDIGQTYLSTATKPIADVFANRDYFGKEIAPEGATPTEKYKSIGNYLLTQYISHPYLKEIFDKRNQGDPAYQRLSRSMELPFRFYNDKSLQGKYYYAARDETLKGLNNQELAAYNAVPKFDVNNNDPQSSITKYSLFLQYPKVFEAKQKTEIEMMAKTGQPVDPLYLVDYNTAKKYMRYETLPPGSQERKDMTKAYPELVALFDVRGKYFDENPIPGQTSKRPIASKEVQAAMDRKDWNYPGVKEYLDANKAYQNEQRALLGLPPLVGYTPYKRKPKSIKVKTIKPKKVKTLKIKLNKPKKVKLKKLTANIKLKKPPKLTSKSKKNIVKLV